MQGTGNLQLCRGSGGPSAKINLKPISVLLMLIMVLAACDPPVTSRTGDDDDCAAASDDDDSVMDDDDSAGDCEDDVDEDGDGAVAWLDNCQVFDCDDNDPTVFPGATETCDDVDRNCDGNPTEGFQDSDGDGDADCVDQDDDGDGVVDWQDCAPLDPARFPGNEETPNDGVDSDCDGDDNNVADDFDNDGWATGDCDDSDPAVFPGAPEICDGEDSDCDGEIPSVELDEDGDGVATCEGDCSDSDAATFPAAPEQCDGVDNDCDGMVPANEMDFDGDGFAECANDCDDSDPEVNPGQDELCNGVDDDCSGTVPAIEGDIDADGFLACEEVECDDNDPNTYEGAPEIPNDGVDQDCSGTDSVTCWEDLDNDGFGSSTSILAHDGNCDSLDEAPVNGDCDDFAFATNPSAFEIVGDGVDQDCDGDDSVQCFEDLDGDGFGSSVQLISTGSCAGVGEASVNGDCDDLAAATNPWMTEIPDDGVDQDCSGADTVSCFEDLDNDGFGSSNPLEGEGNCEAVGLATTAGDCDDLAAATNPSAPEIVGDGIDQDCSGSDATNCWQDLDGDGFGSSVTLISSGMCTGAGEASVNGDCDDLAASTNPGAIDTPEDGVDQDCNGADTVSCFQDLDNDGYGSTIEVMSSEGSCIATGVATVDGDCDDFATAHYPGADEIVGDGIDQDCNGFDAVECYLDNDGDGFGSTYTFFATDGDCMDPGESNLSGDCDDSAAATNPNGIEIVGDGVDQDCSGDDMVSCFEDLDNDTFGSSNILLAVDGDCVDPGEASTSSDCDDTNPAVNSTAIETCDGIDNNCDSLVDDVDADGDGYIAVACGGPDCQDGNPVVNPNANEICNGIDDDCSGLPAAFEIDGDMDGTAACMGDCDDSDPVLNIADADGDGQTSCEGDCADSDPLVNGFDPDGDGVSSCDGDCWEGNPAVFPGNSEACDGLDNNCDLVIDEGFDLDGDNFLTCTGDCDDGDASVFPGAVEVCNSVDDDCDSSIDEGFDLDGDGWSVCVGDCDDNNPDAFPGNSEVCDSADSDCDGAIDNVDDDSDGFVTEACGGLDCDDAEATINPAASEGVTCDLLDNECDGIVDNLDNGSTCAVIEFEISYNHGAVGPIPGGYYAGVQNVTPRQVALSLGYTAVDLAVGYWWGSCGGPGFAPVAPTIDLEVDYSGENCSGYSFETGNPSGYPWQDEGFPLAPADILEADVDPLGVDGYVSMGHNPGWNVMMLVQSP